MESYIDSFLEWLRVRAYSEATVEQRGKYLRYFRVWCAEYGIDEPRNVTKPVLDRYQRYLYHYRKKDGKPMSFRSQRSQLLPVRAFFKWLTRMNYLLSNPASEMEMPRPEKRLPKHVLTSSDVEEVMRGVNLRHSMGLRDRAILETLYSTGVRRMELIRLCLSDLDIERETMLVRQGKGRKDRVLPIGERALAWIRKYMDETRPTIALAPDEGRLFLTMEGGPISPNRLSKMVGDYISAAELGKKGCCHIFRHTMATLMLEGGADIRFIQKMLGHAKLETTEIYTQVSIKQLQEIHAATHPGAKLERKKPKPEVFEKAEDRLAAEEELFSTLAAEEKEEKEEKDN